MLLPMFGIASRYVKARRKAPAFHIQFFICKARALLLARRSLETSPNLIPPTYAQLGLLLSIFHFFICKARALLLARRSLETSPNSVFNCCYQSIDWFIFSPSYASLNLNYSMTAKQTWTKKGFLIFLFLCFLSAQNCHKLTNKILISKSANQWFSTFFLLFSILKVDLSFVLSESCQTAKSLDFQLNFQI